MTDKTASTNFDTSIVQRFRDLLDGTYAQVVALQTPGLTTISSGNVANAAAVATLPGVAGKTTYCTGFEITSAGATAAAVVLATLAGLNGGTATYVYPVLAGVLSANPSLFVAFNPPLPASAVNTTITLTLPALGLGNTNASVVLHGFQA